MQTVHTAKKRYQQLYFQVLTAIVIGVLLLTSKGATGVTGSRFITLAATLSVIPSIPVAGLALTLGVDRFMSETCALTNLIGNGVATVVAAKWENELDMHKLELELNGNTDAAD